MEFIRKNTKLLFLLVLPVYFYIIQSSILNKHTHFYVNGFVVTHSHTLDLNDGEPINNHSHSQTEICLYCNLNINLHTAIVENANDFKSAADYKNILVADVQFEYTSPIYQTVSRGPPFRIL